MQGITIINNTEFTLAADILDAILTLSPQFFESLLVDLRGVNWTPIALLGNTRLNQ